MSNDPNKIPAADVKASRLKEIAGFEIIGKLGQGGMGAVFKARQKSLDRIVALKVLPPQVAKDAKFIERFQREARTSARLNHPNIVQGIDVGKDPATGLWYFAMELVDGPSLKKLLEEQKVIPEERALRMILEVAKALDAIAQNKMVHRDIKPDNILLTQAGEIKLADLGLAKQLTEDSSLTQSGQAVGTPDYMSPEQARGEFDGCDIRTDIYALGATLFHLVTGQPPYQGDTSAVIMTKHLIDPPPKASKVNPAVSEGCSRLIEKMMQKKPDQRIQTPVLLMQQIGKVLSGEQIAKSPPVATKTTGPRTPVADRKREHAAPRGNSKGAIASVLALVVIAGIVYAFKGGGAPVEPVVDNNKKAGPASTESRSKLDTKIAPPVTASPDELFKAALDFETKNPDEYDEATQRFRRAAAAAKGAPHESDMQDKVEDAIAGLQTRRNATIDRLLKAADQKAAEAVANGNYDDALNAYQQAPPALAALIKEKSDPKVLQLRREAESKIIAIVKAAAAYDADAEPEEALKSLAEAEKIAYTPLRGAIATVKKKFTEDLANEGELKQKKAALGAAKRLNEVLQKFDHALLETRDLKIAAEVAAEARKDELLRPVEPMVRAMNDVMAAYDDAARFEVETMAKLKGQKIEVESATGVLRGTVAKVQDGVISLQIDFGGGATGTKSVKVADLAEEQRKKLFPPFVPHTDAQHVAHSYTRLAKGTADFAGAVEHLVQAPDFALTPHCRELAEKIHAEKLKIAAEAAAPGAWEDLHTRASAVKLSEADIKNLNERLARFESDFGATEFAATIKDKLEALKARIARAASPNLVVNGDFEKGTLDGWEMKGGTRVAEITTAEPHSGKCAMLATIPPDYNVSLSQMVTVEPQTEYRVSCWVKHLNGSLDMARGGLYLTENGAERRESEGHFMNVLSQSRVGEWVQVEMKFVPQTNSARVELFLRQRTRATERVSVAVDDIEISRSGKDKTSPLPPAPVPDLLKNAGLVFWVTLSGDPAGTSRELISNTLATDNGTVTLTTNNGLKAMHFDTSYVTYPATEPVKAITTGGSVFVWVKVEKLPPVWAGMISRGDLGVNEKGHVDFSLFMNRDKFMLWLNYPENTWPAVDGKTGFFSKRPLQPGKWMMLGATWDGKSITIWVNGEKDNVYTTTAIPLKRAFPEVISLGCDPAGSPEYFNGLINGAMIFNRPLSEFEIKSLYLLSGIIGK